MSRYNTKEFKQLREHWYKKLADEGFDDLERSSQTGRYSDILKTPDKRTVAWQNQLVIRDFYLALDTYLTTAEIPERDRRILELWSEGTYLIDIARQSNLSYKTIKNIIAKYKAIIISIS